MLRVGQAALVEYGLSLPPLVFVFELNPQRIVRTRTMQVRTGSTPATRGGYDFELPSEATRAAQGASVEPETITLEVLLDATDRMSEGDPVATISGVQPEIDTLRTMVEPKSQTSSGAQLLSSLSSGPGRAFRRDEVPSVLLFILGDHILPVFMTQVRVEENAHLPTLVPYRANVTLTMQVIEGKNPFYRAEKVRQLLGAAQNLGRLAVSPFAGVF